MVGSPILDPSQIDRIVDKAASAILKRVDEALAAATHAQGASMFDLTNRIAIVTGGNGGIGLGMAKGLAEAGATVVIAGRDQAKAQQALAQLSPAASFVAADVARKDDCDALVAATLDKHGRLDILVNNAGMAVRKPPQELTEDEFRRVIDVNLTGAFLLCQAAYPALKRQGGKIINTGSVMSLLGAAHTAAYAASKGGILLLTRSLAVAWAPDNIQVNAILPGYIETELTDAAREQVPGLHEHVLRRTPAGRWGKPRDLAGIAVFLASHASDFVTGAGIPVDGGYLAAA
jgi:2-dehydro-3-deoxy-D-gluconate 5-dehydrogenase